MRKAIASNFSLKAIVIKKYFKVIINNKPVLWTFRIKLVPF